MTNILFVGSTEVVGNVISETTSTGVVLLLFQVMSVGCDVPANANMLPALSVKYNSQNDSKSSLIPFFVNHKLNL